jgi:hypothetical protein
MAVFTDVSAQLIFENSKLAILSGGSVIIRGNAAINNNVMGKGVLVMRGDTLQQLNMDGFAIPQLEIDNPSHVALLGDAHITDTLSLTNGKIQLGNHTLTIAASGVIKGTTGDDKFIETNGMGLFKKQINTMGNYLLPVGTGSRYEPVQVQISGSPVFANAFVTAQSVAGKHPNKPLQSTDYLNEYWILTNGGISGGSMIAEGIFHNGSGGVTGQKELLRPIYWNGSTWISGNYVNPSGNTVAIPLISAAKQELYAMNQFVLLLAKAMLQGAFNSAANLMNDKLRNSGANSAGTLPTSNIIPAADPYRSAPYNFTHTNNPIAESVVSSEFPNPFIDQPNPDNNIVDWVFIELRSPTTPGNDVLQTRSALIQRDGDVVDVDGVSPLYFKNVPPANYTVAIKHRNHLPMCTNPTAFNQLLTTQANTPTLDFSSMPSANLMGTVGLHYFNQNGKNFLYAGNANCNGNIRWNAPYSDRDYILNTVLGRKSGTVLLNNYSQGDIDLNREVRWDSPDSDIDFLLAKPLSNSVAAVKSQALPN